MDPSTRTTREAHRFARSGTMGSAATIVPSRSAREEGAINATDALVLIKARIARIPSDPKTRLRAWHLRRQLKGQESQVQHRAPKVGNPIGADHH